MRRRVVVELPEEAPEDEGRGLDLVGVVELALYDTRDVAISFQQ